MQIHIAALAFPLSDAIREQALAHLEKLTKRFTNEIMTVRILLEDINGPKGGTDKLCKIELAVARGPLLTVQESDADLYVAIRRATALACDAVESYIGRRRALARHPRQTGARIQRGRAQARHGAVVKSTTR